MQFLPSISASKNGHGWQEGHCPPNVILPADSMNDLLANYEDIRITEQTDIPQPKPIIKIAGEIISTAGNITVLSGASKSGKSALASFIIAPALTKEGTVEDSLEGMEVAANEKGFAIIHIDTEQAKYKHQCNLKAILRRAGLAACPDNFLSYNIRQLALDKYHDTTHAIVTEQNKNLKESISLSLTELLII